MRYYSGVGMVDSKRVQRLYDQVHRTRKNCSFEDLERLLLAVGFTERRTKGSHRQVIAILQELGA